MHDLIYDAVMATGAPEIHQAFLGSLISGIFARKDAKRNAKLMAEAAKVPVVTSHEFDAAGMNKSAIDNGYNPLTYLKMGLASAFTKTSVTGQGAMAAAAAAGAVPSFGSVMAGAFGSTLDALAGNAFRNFGSLGKDYFPPAPSPDMGMASAMGWNTIGRTSGGGSSVVGARYAGGATLAANSFGRVGKVGDGRPMYPEVEAPKTQNPYARYGIDPTSPGATAWQERYGDSEIMSMIGGGLTAWDDIWYNVTGMTSDERYKSLGQPVAKTVTNAFDSIKAGALSRDTRKDSHSFGKAAFEFFEPWMGP